MWRTDNTRTPLPGEQPTAAEDGGGGDGSGAAEGSPHADVKKDSQELGHEDVGDAAAESEAGDPAEEPAVDAGNAGQDESIDAGGGNAEEEQDLLDIGGEEDKVAVDAEADSNSHVILLPLDRTMDRTMTPQLHTEFSRTSGGRGAESLGSTANPQVVGEDEDGDDGGSDRQRSAIALSVDVGDMSHDAAEQEVIVQRRRNVCTHFILAEQICLRG